MRANLPKNKGDPAAYGNGLLLIRGHMSELPIILLKQFERSYIN